MRNIIFWVLFIVFIPTIIFSCSPVGNSTIRTEAKIQELTSQVNSLQQEVAYLKGKLEATEARLADKISSPVQSSSSSLSTETSSGENNSVELNSSSSTGDKNKSKSKTPTKSKTKTASKSSAGTSSGQCQAITKKGTQCKRKAAAGSKYCWQHGG